MKLDPAHDLLGNEERDGAWVATCACGRTFLAAGEKAAADLWLDHEVGKAVGAAPVEPVVGCCMLCKRERPAHATVSLTSGGGAASKQVGVLCEECLEGLGQPLKYS